MQEKLSCEVWREWRPLMTLSTLLAASLPNVLISFYTRFQTRHLTLPRPCLTSSPVNSITFHTKDVCGPSRGTKMNSADASGADIISGWVLKHCHWQLVKFPDPVPDIHEYWHCHQDVKALHHHPHSQEEPSQDPEHSAQWSSLSIWWKPWKGSLNINTVQPHRQGGSTRTPLWMTSSSSGFLTSTPTVWINNSLSDLFTTSTDSSPLLLIHNTSTSTIAWSDTSRLELNISKTNETVVTFSGRQRVLAPGLQVFVLHHRLHLPSLGYRWSLWRSTNTWRPSLMSTWHSPPTPRWGGERLVAWLPRSWRTPLMLAFQHSRGCHPVAGYSVQPAGPWGGDPPLSSRLFSWPLRTLTPSSPQELLIVINTLIPCNYVY